jgi:hypothetical protein
VTFLTKSSMMFCNKSSKISTKKWAKQADLL